MHVQIIGITASGKTTLAVRLSAYQRARGYSVLVLDPLRDSRWSADLLTDSPNRFLSSVRKSRSCSLFLDESGETVGRYNEEMFWLATRARHYGHISHFICQGYKQIAPIVRNQCTHLYVFRSSVSDAKLLADECGSEAMLGASALNKFEFIYCQKMGPIRRYILTRDGARRLDNESANRRSRFDSDTPTLEQ